MTANNLLAGLAKSAEILVEEMKQKLSSTGDAGYTYPDAIAKSISTDAPKQDMDGASVEIKLGGEDAPMAAAFEWGSGERAERGTKQDYPIVARNAPLLGFLWKYPSPLGRKYLKPSDEAVSFKSVMHPGIAPNPYIRPSIDDTKGEIRKVLGKAFKADLLIGTQRVTTIEVK